jgi:hypothetical protein
MLMKRLLLAAVAAVGLLAGATSSASANESYRPVTYYRTVVSYEVRQVPYTVHFTRYDHYGYPYDVCETRYRSERYEVKRVVPYVKYVPYCY